jgi:hypothetical protein
MRTWLILACGLALSAWAEEPLTFKGVDLGRATAADVKNVFPSASVVYEKLITARATGADVSGELFRLGRTSAGDFSFYLIDGVVERVRATFTHESYPAVVAAVKTKHGEPTETKAGAITTRAGASLPSTTITWKRADGGLIVITEHAGRVDTMELDLLTSKMAAQDSRERDKSVRDAAKGL